MSELPGATMDGAPHAPLSEELAQSLISRDILRLRDRLAARHPGQDDLRGCGEWTLHVPELVVAVCVEKPHGLGTPHRMVALPRAMTEILAGAGKGEGAGL